MSHIESFNRCAAQIFSELYLAFPLRKNISSINLPEALFDDISDEDFGGVLERSVVFQRTGEWLVEAGYIWAEKVTDETISGAVLSPKGLEILKAMPASISSDDTLGQRMGELLQRGSYDLLSKVVDKALAIGVAITTGTTI